MMTRAQDTPDEVHLSHAEVAALTDYDAQAINLPPHMAAMLVLRVEGRIDLPAFTVTHTIEPFDHMQPWLAYQRTGAILWVGERMMRLNPVQLQVMDALEALEEAGDDIAGRLRAWETLAAALHIQGKHHILVENELPRLRIAHVAALPAKAMTRIDGQLRPASSTPSAQWAMEQGRRYYLLYATAK